MAVAHTSPLEERLIEKASAALEDDVIEDVFVGQAGASPTVRVLASSGLVLAFAAGVTTLTQAPAALMLAEIVIFMFIVLVGMALRVRSRLIAVTEDELVVLDFRTGQVRGVIGRYPKEIPVLGYWDPRWLRARIGNERIWVNRRNFGETLETFSVPAE